MYLQLKCNSGFCKNRSDGLGLDLVGTGPRPKSIPFCRDSGGTFGSDKANIVLRHKSKAAFGKNKNDIREALPLLF